MVPPTTVPQVPPASAPAPAPSPVLDLDARPDLTDGVLARRGVAFVIDAVVMSLAIVAVSLMVTIIGVFTLGAAWLLMGLVGPAVVVAYYALTLGKTGATPGMSTMGVEIIDQTGAPPSPVQAVAHALLFGLSVFVLTPFVLLIGLFTRRRRLLHDLALGTTGVNTAARRLIHPRVAPDR